MPRRPRLIRGKDYDLIDGRIEFTREYLLSLQQCCKQHCLHCPYEPKYGGMSTRHAPQGPGGVVGANVSSSNSGDSAGTQPQCQPE